MTFGRPRFSRFAALLFQTWARLGLLQRAPERRLFIMIKAFIRSHLCWSIVEIWRTQYIPLEHAATR